MDTIIQNAIRSYPTFVHHTIWIGILIAAFVALCGCIRFGIAVWRRHKGIYPPATSQMEDH